MSKLPHSLLIIKKGRYRTVYAIPDVDAHLSELRNHRKGMEKGIYNKLIRTMESYACNVDEIIYNEKACKELRKNAKPLSEFKSHGLRVMWFLWPTDATAIVCVHFFYKDGNGTDDRDIRLGQNGRIDLLNSVGYTP